MIDTKILAALKFIPITFMILATSSGVIEAICIGLIVKFSCCIYVWSGQFLGVFIRTRPSKNEFQWFTTVKRVMVAMEGRETGRKI